MPLSRLTQTLPLDFADEISGSEAAPVGAGLVDFLAGSGALDGGALAAGLAGIEALLAAVVAGAAAGVDEAALVSSDFFFGLFFGVAVSVVVAV